MPELDIDITFGDVTAESVLDTDTSPRKVAGKCRLAGWSLRAVGAQSSAENSATIVSPAQFANVVTLALPAGEWVITWEVMVTGTTGAPEVNNFLIKNGATNLVTSVNGSTVGVEYPQTPLTVIVPAGGANISIITAAAGTVGASYTASITASPVGAVAIMEITSGGNPVAEISLPVGASVTNYMGGNGVGVLSDLTANVISGAFRGSIFAVILLQPEVTSYDRRNH